MTKEKVPKLEFYIVIKGQTDEETARKKTEKVKSELEKIADDFEINYTSLNKVNKGDWDYHLNYPKPPKEGGEKKADKDTYYAYIGGKTSKETYEKTFEAKIEYRIDPDYRPDVKIWIGHVKPKIPEQFKEDIEEIGLDYW